QLFDFINVPNEPTELGTQTQNASIFKALAVYDHSLGRGRIAFQYEPRLSIINGHVEQDLINHDFGFDVSYQPTARLTLALSDRYQFYKDQSLFESLNLDADLNTGTLLQSRFLQGNGSFLTNRVGGSISYALSPISHVDVQPSFVYSKA